jgi:hypothetical protein
MRGPRRPNERSKRGLSSPPIQSTLQIEKLRVLRNTRRSCSARRGCRSFRLDGNRGDSTSRSPDHGIGRGRPRPSADGTWRREGTPAPAFLASRIAEHRAIVRCGGRRAWRRLDRQPSICPTGDISKGGKWLKWVPLSLDIVSTDIVSTRSMILVVAIGIITPKFGKL